MKRRWAPGIFILMMACQTGPDFLTEDFPAYQKLVQSMNGSSPGKEVYKTWRQDQPQPLTGPQGTLLTYFGPTETQVQVQLDQDEDQRLSMKKDPQGLWTLRIPGPPMDLGYRFILSAPGEEERVVLDPFNPYQDWQRDGYSRLILPGSPSGAVYYHPGLPTQNTFRKFAPRPLLIWLPPGYFQDPERRYPVLYLHDGQQILDSDKAAFGGWKLNTTAQRLAKEGKMELPILVGVFNSSRRDDELMGWSPFHQMDQKEKKDQSPEDTLNAAKAYDYFFTTEVRQWVETHFRARNHRNSRAVAGASSGAMEALFQLFQHPDLYSGAAALSGGEKYYADLRNQYFSGRKDLRIYLDCGGLGIDGVLLAETQAMKDFLIKKGFVPGQGFDYREFPEDNHNERAWARRSEYFLPLLFPPGP